MFYWGISVPFSPYCQYYWAESMAHITRTRSSLLGRVRAYSATPLVGLKIPRNMIGRCRWQSPCRGGRNSKASLTMNREAGLNCVLRKKSHLTILSYWSTILATACVLLQHKNNSIIDVTIRIRDLNTLAILSLLRHYPLHSWTHVYCEKRQTNKT